VPICSRSVRSALLAIAGGIAVLLPVSRAEAQSPYFMGISWTVSVPTGNTKAFTPDPSYRGITFDFRQMRGAHRSYGIQIAWTVFDEKTSKTTQLLERDGAVHGTQFRTTNAFPLLVTAHFYAGKNSVRPYAGAGIGAYAIKKRLELGTFTENQTKWHFGGYPEVGLIFPLGRDLRGFVSAKYNYAVKTASAPAESWFAFNLGIAEF